jgi:hypothetical protein
MLIFIDHGYSQIIGCVLVYPWIIKDGRTRNSSRECHVGSIRSSAK